jgi:hypothetical protein
MPLLALLEQQAILIDVSALSVIASPIFPFKPRSSNRSFAAVPQRIDHDCRCDFCHDNNPGQQMLLSCTNAGPGTSCANYVAAGRKDACSLLAKKNEVLGV